MHRKLVLLLLLLTTQSMAHRKVIYGVDNRVEAEQFPDHRFVEASESVASVVWSNKLIQDPLMPQIYNFKKVSLQFTYNICREEKFSQQVPLGNCTAFLVAPDLVLTAGHCISDQSQCEQSKFVFDHKEDTIELDQSQVYSCKKIIERKLINDPFKVKDFALIQLDRTVSNRSPLSLRPTGKVEKNTPLVVIGHPLGLPMKTTDDAIVSKLSARTMFTSLTGIFKFKNYFITNTDTYGGNSGSPVFNEQTGLVEGMLIQGANDFYETKDGCMRSNIIKDSRKNRDEKVLRILSVDNLSNHIRDSYHRALSE
ncbi:serine protease [Halobacteriovorax sp. HLS]|uniref:trypsin-like serine peptidase n=1 Tax=Halobacteriovorax sp. HLS TaxID=2234000 RepID=UPI0013E2A1DA|nr:serine protease [Halobacteriovorax sp. HLS]